MLKKGQHMQDYIGCTFEMMECLQGIEEKIKYFIAERLLTGLSHSYGTFVRALDVHPEYIKGKPVEEYAQKNIKCKQ